MTTEAVPSSNMPAPASGDEIIAEPDAGFRWKHLIMAAILIGVGGWFAYDGWINWPRENAIVDHITVDFEKAQREKNDAKIEELAKELKKHEKHNEASILLQKFLAFACPIAGVAYGFWTLRSTRGRYRLEGNTLYVPGHPPISIMYDVRRVDKRKWERKGIAFLHYDQGNPPQPGVMKLDDFAYERKGTDEILARVEHHMHASAPQQAPVPKVVE